MNLLNAMFGPSKDAVWRQLSEEIHASFIEGGFWRGSKVEATVREWTVILDTFSVFSSATTTSTTYTRMRAPYINKDGFRFTMRRKGLFGGMDRLAGMQDIETGDAGFDQAFVVQSNDESKVRALFANPTIRRLIEEQPAMRLEVKDDEGRFGPRFPEGVDELYCEVAGVIKEIERLKSLYELFAEILDQLCRIGSAYTDDPQTELR